MIKFTVGAKLAKQKRPGACHGGAWLKLSLNFFAILRPSGPRPRGTARENRENFQRQFGSASRKVQSAAEIYENCACRACREVFGELVFPRLVVRMGCAWTKSHTGRYLDKFVRGRGGGAFMKLRTLTSNRTNLTNRSNRCYQASFSFI